MPPDGPLEDQQAIAALASGVAKRLRAKQPPEQVLEYLTAATRWPPERAQTFIANIAAQESAPRPSYSGGEDPEVEATEQGYLIQAIMLIVALVVGALVYWVF
jgi:hypothetical protein